MSAYLPLDEPIFEKGVLFGPSSASKQGIYEESETQKYALGTKWVYGDGRIFRYAKNYTTALGKALMCQTHVVETKALNVAQTAHAQVVGATDIQVLITTASAFSDNEFVGGTMWFNSTVNVGESYKIVASALDPSGDTKLNLKLETPIRVAVGATARITLAPNPWWDIVVFPTTCTGSPVGVPLIAVTASYFCWLQTGGDCPLYVDGGETAVIGNAVGHPATYATAGCGGVWQTLMPQWGYWRTVNAAAEVGCVYLILDS